MVESTLQTLTREEIQQRIPHRSPFLWLDEVVDLQPASLKARKYVDPGLDVFRGHYPGHPILPGVLQCEAIFQAGAVLIASSAPPVDGLVPVVTRLNQVQFRRMVSPGQTMDIQVELVEHVANAYFLKGKISVEGQVTVRLEFACALAPPQ